MKALLAAAALIWLAAFTLSNFQLTVTAPGPVVPVMVDSSGNVMIDSTGNVMLGK